jgi:hypothetical protein
MILKMKIISFELKKISVGRIFPKENKVELIVEFNDGMDRKILKPIGINDSEPGEGILSDIRKLERKLNKDEGNGGTIIDNFINIVVKDEDILAAEILNFVNKLGSKLNEINQKKDAEGYLDMIRGVKALKLDF